MTYKNNTVESVASGETLMRTEILSIIDEQLQTGGTDDIASVLGFTTENVEQIDGKYTSMLGAEELKRIGEFDEFPIVGREQGYEKGYKLERFAGRLAVSKPLEKWLDVAISNVKYSPDVKRELNNLSRNARDLVDGAAISKNNLITRVLTRGFYNESAFGAGSPTGDNKALFASDHIIKATGATQSNLISGALSQTKLEEAIGVLRNMKNGRGRKMRRAPYYTLVVSSEKEADARRILNDGSMYAASVKDVATGNDVTENIFAWDGFKIRLVVLDTLNQPSEEYGVIGDANQWFVINTEAAIRNEAFKVLKLYDNEIDMGRDGNTKVSYVDLDFSSVADAYDYTCIVGSLGA